MENVVVVYASTTGNTEAMANAVAEGAGVSAVRADEADAGAVKAASAIALGSPAMGSEELEDSMESFFSSIESSLSGKKIALFGSYDWGEGEWLRSWEERAKAAGAVVTGSLKAHLSPESDDLEACKALGRGLLG